MKYGLPDEGKEESYIGIRRFFKGKDNPQKLISLQRFRELVVFLEGKAFGRETRGVFNLAPPPIPSCPECGFRVELLPGSVSSGIGLQKDSGHYLRCRGPAGHLFGIRLLS